MARRIAHGLVLLPFLLVFVEMLFERLPFDVVQLTLLGVFTAILWEFVDQKIVA